MLIAGAGGHAVELFGILRGNGYEHPVCFYDDVAEDAGLKLLLNRPVLRNVEEASMQFLKEKDFCIGVGKPSARKLLASRLQEAGGSLCSVISKDALIGTVNIQIGNGLNIMQGAVITAETRIGNGVLIHVNVSIHHDTVIGEYCELSPGCRILGGVTLGSGVSVGTNAVVMRNITVGDNAVIGAGAVVTKDVPAGKTVVGVPARIKGKA